MKNIHKIYINIYPNTQPMKKGHNVASSLTIFVSPKLTHHSLQINAWHVFQE